MTVRMIRPYLSAALVAALPALSLTAAPPSVADCVNANGTTLCAQGDVRGGGSTTSSTPYVPYPCENDWYCDNWGMDVILGSEYRPPTVNPSPPPDFGRPGRPGGGGGGGGIVGPR